MIDEKLVKLIRLLKQRLALVGNIRKEVSE